MAWFEVRAFRGRLAISTALASLVCGAAQGAEWERSAGMALSGIYTDNVCLENRDEESDVIGTATPSVNLNGQGARARMSLYAAVQFNSLDIDDLECRVRGAEDVSPAPRVRFDGSSELVENWLYLDADAFADQNRINPFAVGGEDPLNSQGNLNTTYQYGISPYISRRLTPKSRMLISYRYSEEYNSEELINDNQLQQVTFDIGTLPELSRFSMGVSGSYTEIDYEERTGGDDLFNSELSSARVRAAFQVNRTWQVNGYVGEEWNDYVTVFQENDGTFWDVGVTWTPNVRTTVAVGTGERFFGSTPRASVEYRHKRSSLRASYARQLTYDRSLRGSDSFAEDIDDLGDSLPEQDEVIGVGGQETTNTNSPILNERFQLVYTYDARRTSFTVNASHSEQTRAEDGFTDTFIYAGVGVERDLSRRLRAYTRLSWHRRDPDEARVIQGTRQSDLARLTLGLERDLGRHTRVGLIYQYNDRSSDVPVDEYTENRIILRFSYQI